MKIISAKSILCLFTATTLVNTDTLYAQLLENASFEDSPQENVPPSGWIPCQENSTPDTQPGFWEVVKPPSDGDSYIGMVIRGNLGPYANQTEDAYAQLNYTIQSGEEVALSIDLAKSENWGHTIGFGSEFLSYDAPAKLLIYGGTSSCDNTELLWESPAITHSEWETYYFSLKPINTDVSHLYLKADYSTDEIAFGNILIDNIRECSFELDWVSDSTICESASLRIDASIPNGSYQWQDGYEGPVYTITENGNYSVLISNGCISETFSIDVETRNCNCDTAVPIQTIPFDTVVCEGTNLTLMADTPGGIYNWSNGSEAPSIDITEPGLYSVEVSNLCEVETFQYLVENFECNCEVFVPNVFTPNGDEINDEFNIKVGRAVSEFEITIIDRNGKIIFRSNDVKSSWDGKLNGRKIMPGVFYYNIEATCISKSELPKQTYRGTITLML